MVNHFFLGLHIHRPHICIDTLKNKAFLSCPTHVYDYKRVSSDFWPILFNKTLIFQKTFFNLSKSPKKHCKIKQLTIIYGFATIEEPLTYFYLYQTQLSWTRYRCPREILCLNQNEISLWKSHKVLLNQMS